MLFKPTKVITIFLLAAFLVSSFGSIFGCISCDHGSLSSTHLASHLDDHSENRGGVHSQESLDIHTTITLNEQICLLDQHFRGDSDSCVDSQIKLGFGLIEDSPNLESPDQNFKTDDLVWAVVTSQNETFLQSSYLKPKPRISLAILSQRTVVLLS